MILSSMLCEHTASGYELSVTFSTHGETNVGLKIIVPYGTPAPQVSDQLKVLAHGVWTLPENKETNKNESV